MIQGRAISCGGKEMDLKCASVKFHKLEGRRKETNRFCHHNTEKVWY